MTDLLIANLPILFLTGLWVVAVYLVKYIASRFLEPK